MVLQIYKTVFHVAAILFLSVTVSKNVLPYLALISVILYFYGVLQTKKPRYPYSPYVR